MGRHLTWLEGFFALLFFVFNQGVTWSHLYFSNITLADVLRVNHLGVSKSGSSYNNPGLDQNGAGENGEK